MHDRVTPSHETEEVEVPSRVGSRLLKKLLGAMADEKEVTKTKTPRRRRRRRPRRAQNSAPASATGSTGDDPPVIDPYQRIDALLRSGFPLAHDRGTARRAALMLEGFITFFQALVGEADRDSYWHTIEITGDGAQLIINSRTR